MDDMGLRNDLPIRLRHCYFGGGSALEQTTHVISLWSFGRARCAFGSEVQSEERA